MASLTLITSAFFNLFKKPACYMYPFKTRDFFPNTRGTLQIDIDKCIYCGICVKKCPSQAIEVKRVKPAKPDEPAPTEKSTWTLTRNRCVTCSSCIENCPKKCLYFDPKTYNASSTSKIGPEVHQNA
ncbi:MAG: 4Fe-4S dicluster domain-containing protein [Fibrobacteres bacterium]|nr:4Fe-4S dicluster domain-containing protein [Fibrobacterota bacterium]